ncbi:MAG: MIP/aquaporin family protein [Rhodovibrionaceae bacterium]|nr:MIP/aquaporin family protein [Rhodovibrionaceae bacterium]
MTSCEEAAEGVEARAEERARFTRKVFAEWLGTAFLLAGVVGSGIMGERLADGNVALALLGNTIATGAILAVLILIFAPISGAHFNPAVTLAFFLRQEIAARQAAIYVIFQVAGGLFGVIAAHVMFAEPLLAPSGTGRDGFPQWTGEFVATFGLVATILGCLRHRPEAVPYAVGLFITSGYWFTSSTSFANPAVTIARSWTDTFAGIAPSHAPAFILAQLLGAAAATLAFRWLGAVEAR